MHSSQKSAGPGDKKELEVLLQKTGELALEKSEKSAKILTAWINEKLLKKPQNKKAA